MNSTKIFSTSSRILLGVFTLQTGLSVALAQQNQPTSMPTSIKSGNLSRSNDYVIRNGIEKFHIRFPSEIKLGKQQESDTYASNSFTGPVENSGNFTTCTLLRKTDSKLGTVIASTPTAELGKWKLIKSEPRTVQAPATFREKAGQNGPGLVLTFKHPTHGEMSAECSKLVVLRSNKLYCPSAYFNDEDDGMVYPECRPDDTPIGTAHMLPSVLNAVSTLALQFDEPVENLKEVLSETNAPRVATAFSRTKK
jgi:hypothetical protein